MEHHEESSSARNWAIPYAKIFRRSAIQQDGRQLVEQQMPAAFVPEGPPVTVGDSGVGVQSL